MLRQKEIEKTELATYSVKVAETCCCFFFIMAERSYQNGTWEIDVMGFGEMNSVHCLR